MYFDFITFYLLCHYHIHYCLCITAYLPPLGPTALIPGLEFYDDPPATLSCLWDSFYYSILVKSIIILIKIRIKIFINKSFFEKGIKMSINFIIKGYYRWEIVNLYWISMQKENERRVVNFDLGGILGTNFIYKLENNTLI